MRGKKCNVIIGTEHRAQEHMLPIALQICCKGSMSSKDEQRHARRTVTSVHLETHAGKNSGISSETYTSILQHMSQETPRAKEVTEVKNKMIQSILPR